MIVEQEQIDLEILLFMEHPSFSNSRQKTFSIITTFYDNVFLSPDYSKAYKDNRVQGFQRVVTIFIWKLFCFADNNQTKMLALQKAFRSAAECMIYVRSELSVFKLI